MEPTQREEPTGAVAVQRAYDVSVWLFPKVEKFPRFFRHSLGERILARSLDICELLTQAAYSQRKVDLLTRAQQALNSLRILLRMAKDLRLLDSAAHHFASGHIEELGRMTGGWLRRSAGK